MYISHLFEAVRSGGFGVGLVSFPKLLYTKNLNCLIKGDIYLSFSLGPSVHQGSGQTIASQAKCISHGMSSFGLGFYCT